MTSLVTPDGRPPVPQGRQPWSRFSARVPVGLRDEDVHSDVVREAQELVEWVLKGVLRAVGVEPPKFHDVGALLVEHQAKFLPPVRDRLPRAAEISWRLRRERELAFDGDIDFIPTEQYTADEARWAYEDAAWVVRLAVDVIERLEP